MARAVRGRAALAVVGDRDTKVVGRVRDRDRGGGALARVLHDVGQRLLDDAVRRKVDAGRHRAGLALDRQLDREPGLPHLLDQSLEVGQTGLRRCPAVPGIGVGVAQHRQQPAHVGQGGRVGLLDRVERATDGILVATDHGSPTAGLQDRHRDGVRHHVVQLTGDPRSFPCDGMLAFDEECLLPLAPQPDRDTCRPRRTDEQGGEADVFRADGCSLGVCIPQRKATMYASTSTPPTHPAVPRLHRPSE